MALWLDVTRAAAGLNVVLLVVLGVVWLRNYRAHGASHTLGLLVVAAFLLIENALWLYFYVIHPGFIGWFVNSTQEIQVGLMFLCGLEFIALLVLARITWQ